MELLTPTSVNLLLPVLFWRKLQIQSNYYLEKLDVNMMAKFVFNVFGKFSEFYSSFHSFLELFPTSVTKRTEPLIVLLLRAFRQLKFWPLIL